MILCNFVSLRAFTVYMENSLRFEISLRSNWPKWNLHQSDFHSARSHVNADNEVILHRSEILPQVKSQTSLSSLRVSWKRALSFYLLFMLLFKFDKRNYLPDDCAWSFWSVKFLYFWSFDRIIITELFSILLF